jgi:predicted nucleic acid-binding protein
MIESRAIYWDTNVFIMLREQSNAAHDLLWQILGAAQGKLTFSTSAMTFSELKVKPLQDRNLPLLQTYEDWASPSGRWMEILPISDPILDMAALLRATRPGVKLPDAVHLASALQLRCDHFLSADMGLKDISDLHHPISGNLNIAPLTVLRTDEPTLSSLLASLA